MEPVNSDANSANNEMSSADSETPNTDPQNEEYVQQTSKFIQETSLDKMLEMADEAVRKKILERASQPPKWVLPED
ncbi:MAG: hypothetical protein ACFB0E_18155 [Leptolyngbyaceae cyanobacterium]